MFIFFRSLRNLSSKFSIFSSFKNVVLLLVNGFLVLIFSLFVTLLLRSILLPKTVDFELPLNFLFRSCEFSPTVDYNRLGVICSYLESNISMKNEETDEFLLEKGVSYNLDVEITFPDSDVNRDAGGMFLLVVSLLDEKFTTRRQFRRSSSLPYSSGLIRRLKKLIFLPFYLTNIWSETVKIQLKIFQDLNLNVYESEIYWLKMEFRHIFLEITRAKLKLTANLRGLTYFLYYWPWTTSISIFCWTIFCATFFSLFYWSAKILPLFFNFFDHNINKVEKENVGGKILPKLEEFSPKIDNYRRQINMIGDRRNGTLFEQYLPIGSWFEPGNNLRARRRY